MLAHVTRRRFLTTAVGLSAGSQMLPFATLLAADDLGVRREQAVARAAEYLRTKGQGADGSYTPTTGPAVTALVTTALLRHGRTASDPLVAKSLKYLESFVQSDGGIYQPESNYRNYETCLSLVCWLTRVATITWQWLSTAA